LRPNQERGADAVFGQHPEQVVGCRRRDTADRDDDVAALETGGRRWTARLDAGDQDA